MAEKLTIEIYKKKAPEELTLALADNGSKLEAVSAAALTAASAAALLKRAASLCENGERTEYIQRNAEIIRGYMVYLIDEDVKCRAPLRKALKEGDESIIEAARQGSTCIAAEVINMLSQMAELTTELADVCPKDAYHYLEEGAYLAIGAAESCRAYILRIAEKSLDETYRFVTRRENEITLSRIRELFNSVVGKISF